MGVTGAHSPVIVAPIGASAVLVFAVPSSPLAQPWSVVGGNVLSTLLRSTRHSGCVAACGLAASHELPITVYPFILRAVTLAGIGADSWSDTDRPERRRLAASSPTVRS